MTEDELSRRVSALEHDHGATRWYVGRVDRDLAEIGSTQIEHGRKLDQLTGDVAGLKGDVAELKTTAQEHSGRLDSIEMQLRSLAQLVGQSMEAMDQKLDKVLKRLLPEAAERKPEQSGQ